MGCCGVTYEDEVEEKITEYMKTLKNPDNTKKRILQEIKNDLIRRANTVDRYYYPYRMEDVDKTVNFYKNYISMRLKGFVEFYEVRNVPPKLEVAKKEEQTKKKDESDDESQKEKNENNDEIVISKKEPTKLNKNMNNVNANVNSEIKEENEDENEITNNNKNEDKIIDNNKSIEMDIVNQKKEEEINTDIKEQKENNNITENNTDLKKDETGENNELN